MLRSTLSLVALCAMMLVAPRAEANNYFFGCPITIDDFDSGALQPANGPFEFTHLGLPPQSCAGGSRRVYINDIPTHTAGMVLLGGNDIGFQIHTEDDGPDNDIFTGADVVLDYVMSQPMDLTAGGLNDHFIIDVVSVSYMSVFVQFSVGGGWSGKTLLLEPGVNVLFLSQVLVDVTQITRIALYFHEYSLTNVSELTMSRIRVTGNTHKHLLLDLPTLVQIFPPFVLPGPLMRTSYPEDDGTLTESLQLALSLQAAVFLPPLNGEFPVEMHSSDSGLDDREPGLSAGFAAFEASAGKASHSDGRFEFTLGFQSSLLRYPGRIHVGDAVEMPNADVFYIPFEVDVMDEAGAVAGRCMYRLRVAIPMDQAYDIQMAAIFPPDPIQNPEFGFGFEIRDDGTSGKSRKAAGQPLFEITLEGDWQANGNFTAAPVPVDAGSLLLTAAPSVTSDRTVLSLSRRLDRPAVLRVYDLAGRVVRSMNLPAGMRSTTWDTRDNHGHAVASGVYVARVTGAGHSATRKLVVVR
jgi:hypothetical protein